MAGPGWRPCLAAVRRGRQGGDAVPVAAAPSPPVVPAAAVAAAPAAGVRAARVCAVYRSAACALGLAGSMITRL